MTDRAQPAATMGAYGDISTHRRSYKPLDRVIVRVTGRAAGDTRCRIRVCDANLVPYHEAEADLVQNHAELSFRAAGVLGTQWIYLHFPGQQGHSRYVNFVLRAETAIHTGNPAYDDLYPLTREALQLGRRVFDSEDGRFVGYISGDTWRIDGVWLRDWIYQLPAYACWEREMACGLDRFLEAQNPDGSIPDGIRRDGTRWRAAVESDVEYILVLGVYRTWMVTGDDAWLAQALPGLERALDYVRNDDMRWDQEHGLVKRGHTCDTWDFEIHESAEFAARRAVVANCDQSGYYAAYLAMVRMCDHLGDSERAARYQALAGDYRGRANELLWDGAKYLHHVHLTPFDHPGFDESQQLAMGNVWAITRGLAGHDQAVAIINEYRLRHQQTGDAAPWWSLQPGYPDELGYYDPPFLKQGGYANGGLMPWVGGELCRGAFLNGMEDYGLSLYRGYLRHLATWGNRVNVWLWPDGQPGFRTTNEVPYTGWGMAQWWHALLEGLAGIRGLEPRLRVVELAPRWAATGEWTARATLAYASNDAYIAYDMSIDQDACSIRIRYTGSGERARFHVLCPEGWRPAAVRVSGKEQPFSSVLIEDSLYVGLEAEISGVRQVEILCERGTDHE